VSNEELVLNTEGSAQIRAILAEDSILGDRRETFVTVRLDVGQQSGKIVLLEPGNDDAHVGRGILVAKQLIAARDQVSLRLMNVNSYPVKLKKGTILGNCVAVSSIHHQIRTLPNDTSADIPPKLASLIAETSQGRNANERRRIQDLFLQYRDVFDVDDGVKGRSNIVRHKIDTGDAKPIRQPPRRLPLAKREEAGRILKEMSAEGVIETSNSPWASPVVLV